MNAGTYILKVTAKEGTNFLAGDVALGNFVVSKKAPDVASFVYKIPTGHYVAQTTPFGIGTVTLKGTGYGDITVLYNGSATVPNTAGSYTVTARGGAGDNYTATSVPVALGTYVIGAVSVAESNREIPGTVVVGEAAVAPVKAAAAAFSVGPNVASKAAGKVAFFSGSSVKSGSLYIFDANGNAVAKVTANGNGGKIGEWNLQSKGVKVGAGAYVVKGALIGKDGTRTKVSAPFAVVE
ncbi:hypothetical protein R80B4_00638 [Fibrobacteres bacterium R8-0-B4]